MRYTVTPLNVLMLALIVLVIWQYATAAHDDGLRGTGMVFGIIIGIIGLGIDLAFQRFLPYKWMMVIESVIAIVLLVYSRSKGMF